MAPRHAGGGGGIRRRTRSRARKPPATTPFAATHGLWAESALPVDVTADEFREPAESRVPASCPPVLVLSSQLLRSHVYQDGSIPARSTRGFAAYAEQVHGCHSSPPPRRRRVCGRLRHELPRGVPFAVSLFFFCFFFCIVFFFCFFLVCFFFFFFFFSDCLFFFIFCICCYTYVGTFRISNSSPAPSFVLGCCHLLPMCALASREESARASCVSSTARVIEYPLPKCGSRAPMATEPSLTRISLRWRCGSERRFLVPSAPFFTPLACNRAASPGRMRCVCPRLIASSRSMQASQRRRSFSLPI